MENFSPIALITIDFEGFWSLLASGKHPQKGRDSRQSTGILRKSGNVFGIICGFVALAVHLVGQCGIIWSSVLRGPIEVERIVEKG